MDSLSLPCIPQSRMQGTAPHTVRNECDEPETWDSGDQDRLSSALLSWCK